MSQLIRYDAACRAIAEAKAVDEVKAIRDRAIAFRAYARQAKNKDLEADAVEIRMRATRRMDQMRQEQAKTVGLARGGGGKHGRKRVTEKPTLKDAGIDKNLAHEGRKLGALSDEQFEQAVNHARDAVSRAVKSVVLEAEIVRSCLFHKSTTTEWHTPAKYIGMARRVMGGIDLDPCSSAQANKTIQAARFFDEKADGLSHIWRGRVWLNPPYSTETKAFVQKLLLEHKRGHVEQAIILLSVNVLDRTWVDPLWDFTLCFHHGRVNFDPPDPSVTVSSPPMGAVFIYIGANTTEFIRQFNQVGACLARATAARRKVARHG
jgi:hypothetical protein